MEWLGYLALFAAGCVAGTLNVIAGGGSFLTLPVLIFLGLPAGIANATNRVAIFLQNVGAVWSFQRFGVLDTRSLLWAAVPATTGRSRVPGWRWCSKAPSRSSAWEPISCFLSICPSSRSRWR